MRNNIVSCQCGSTKNCKNNKCFWMLRDNYQYPVFWYEDMGKDQNKILNEIGIKQKDVYFPKTKTSIGTNCIEIFCEDFKE